MRIATCNILHGVDVRRLSREQRTLPPDAVDLEAVAEWLADLDADVIALQEVDHHLPRSGDVDQVAWLADRLGVEGVFVPALAGDPDRSWEEVPDQSRPDGGLPAGTPAYGVGLLSRVGLSAVRRVRLPHGGAGSRDGEATPTNPGADREPRVMASAVVGHDGVGSPDGEGLHVATTHLSYMFWRAIPQLGHAMAAAEGGDGRRPGLLVGDINLPMWGGWLALHAQGLHPWSWPRGATRRAGWSHHAGEATWPSWQPRLQLDQVFARNLPGSPTVRVGPAGPSDHLPLVVDL